MAKEFYPPIIKRLPKADIPFPGIEDWVAQDKELQVAFFEIGTPSHVVSYCHGAQFGIVLAGEMSLSIEGKGN